MNCGFFDDNFFLDKRIIIIGPANSSYSYLSSEMIDKFDLIVRVNDSPNTLMLHKNLGTRTDILYHNLFLKSNLEINEKLLLSQSNKYVLYNWNLSHLEPNFNKAKHIYGKLLIFKLHPIYYSSLINKYIKFRISPTTGILALNHLMRQKFKELHVVGFTFYKTNYIDGYNGIVSSTIGDDFDKVISDGYHHPGKDFEMFVKLYFRYCKNKKIFLDDFLKKSLLRF
jgi:hypothetical protein